MSTDEETQIKHLAIMIADHDMDIVDLVLKYMVDKLGGKPVSQETLMGEVKQHSQELVLALYLLPMVMSSSQETKESA